MRREILHRVAIVGVFVVLMYSLYALPLANWVTVIVDWAQQRPIVGPATYIACVVIATVLFVPGSGSMMIAGFLFGLLPGMVFAAVGIAAGAHCAFLVGRKGARHWVEDKVAGSPRLRAIETGLHQEAFFIVILTRLSLVIPFNLLNYAYGVTSVRPRTHFVATAIGMLPAVALYVYLGTLARDLGEILSGDATPSALGYWLAGAGIVALIVLTWTIHRAASRALDRHLEAAASENDED
jgi:uncharacterized membrane protein YdjX (TVP38/TMEM64 family)